MSVPRSNEVDIKDVIEAGASMGELFKEFCFAAKPAIDKVAARLSVSKDMTLLAFMQFTNSHMTGEIGAALWSAAEEMDKRESKDEPWKKKDDDDDDER